MANNHNANRPQPTDAGKHTHQHFCLTGPISGITPGQASPQKWKYCGKLNALSVSDNVPTVEASDCVYLTIYIAVVIHIQKYDHYYFPSLTSKVLSTLQIFSSNYPSS